MMRPQLAVPLLLLVAGGCGDAESPSKEPTALREAVATGSPAVHAWASALLEGTPIQVDAIYAATGAAGEATPPREGLRQARSAKLVVLQGAGFAKWARQAALPESRTTRLIERDDPRILLVEERTHAHGAAGEHTHRGADGHTWLDPEAAAAQLSRLADLLVETFPAHEATIRGAEQACTREIATELARLRAALPAEGEVPVGLGIHGHGYGYLVRAWGGRHAELDLPLNQRLTPADWSTVRSQLGSEGGLLLVPEAPVESLVTQLREELRVVCVVVPSGAEARPAEAWWQERRDAISALIAGFEALSDLRAGE